MEICDGFEKSRMASSSASGSYSAMVGNGTVFIALSIGDVKPDDQEEGNVGGVSYELNEGDESPDVCVVVP